MSYVSPASALNAGIVLVVAVVSFVLFINQRLTFKMIRSKHSFTLSIIMGLYSLCALCDAATWLFEKETGSMFFRFALILDYVLFVLVSAIFHSYLSDEINTYVQLPKFYNYIGYLVAGIMGILWILSMRYGFFYSLEGNVYSEGPLYLLAQIPMYLIYIVDFWFIFQHVKEIQPMEFQLYTTCLFVATIGILLATFGGVPAVYVSYLIILILVHLQADIRKTSKLAEQQTRIESEEALLSLVQIKPHFIYNCMNVIQTLCTTDPALAQEATMHFSRFMRGYVDALDNVQMIPLEDEMYMIKHYIFLSKLRYGEERIQFVSNLEEEDFFIPALSIEPFIENAIKYGLMAKAPSGGTVTLHTYATPTDYIIEISDDGVGFDTTTATHHDTSKSHVGMKNVKKRLQSLCGGDVKVTSTIGEGTTVTVSIPKKKPTTNKVTMFSTMF